MLATKEKNSIIGKEKMDGIIKMLENGIKEIFVSGKYQKYLSAMSRFHNYSYRNTMLILMQKPDASYIAGFNTWKKFGRSVIKGQTGIRILAPMSITKEISCDKRDNGDRPLLDSHTGQQIKEMQQIKMQMFRSVSVFDISQTSGKPLPELAPELKSHLDNADILEKAIRNVADCQIEYAAISGGLKGYYLPLEHKIVIREGMSSSQTIKTMVHELAHSRLHCKISKADMKDKATMEVEAESIAFVVLQYLGIDTSDYSFGYLAGWSHTQELKELSASLSLIQKESDILINLISEELATVE